MKPTQRAEISQATSSDCALRIADFLLRMETERMELFRLYLQSSLRRVSPLLIDLAAFENISLKTALTCIHPPQSWPQRPLYSPPWFRFRISQQRKYWLRRVCSHEPWHFERAFADPGVIIRRCNHAKGRYAIRPFGTVLGFSAAIGPCVLSAFGPTAVLKLPDQVPETFLASMTGRILNEIVEHPIFAQRKYIIRRAEADTFDGLPIITFGAKMLRFTGPWYLPAGLALHFDEA